MRTDARRIPALMRRGGRSPAPSGNVPTPPPPPVYPFTIYTDSGYKDVTGTDYAIAERNFYAP